MLFDDLRFCCCYRTKDLKDLDEKQTTLRTVNTRMNYILQALSTLRVCDGARRHRYTSACQVYHVDLSRGPYIVNARKIMAARSLRQFREECIYKSRLTPAHEIDELHFC